jgi:hypothetical protein
MNKFVKIINLISVCLYAGFGYQAMFNGKLSDSVSAAISITCFLLCSIFFDNYNNIVKEELEQLIKQDRE